MIAGEKISYLPGTAVEPGGFLHGRIAPSGPWCGTMKGSLADATASNAKTNPNPGEIDSDFIIYPNPTTGEFLLELREEVTGDPVHVQCYDLSGYRILDRDISSGRKLRLDLSGHQPGIYMLRILSGTECRIQKIVLL